MCVCVERLRECVCKEKKIERVYLIVRLFVRYVRREREREREREIARGCVER